ncbi:LysR family transcriptional regulator [Xanthomonas arboricola pv. juglandis]|uniref:LysR family transcriptional regulator n=1 Tax=Xanthomonas TaxID=338 RepID=UPI000C86B4C3|nr:MULTISPECIES: LysR family transcriptional regulator [Xanthomonas]CAD2249684.1 LysR family transcriptional regulator [Xanthomonas arboricola]PMR85767.1 LysR family transcriptional regulator [Xanthomonas arboricola pv. juglandis]CAD1796272.1 LysR family transcriptional regulator [Xanthomonas sp. CPBF 426]CAG2095918.1 LysR family transcriptional regulator [Xanthomonas euroxanthea]SYZ51384.1 LysR family transcriptional regulator [Xanthomonas arboricola pv. juglandis]
MDRLTSLAVFVKAVDLGSFSAAGASLQMSSQLVGKHVQGLESRLGVRLLSRTTRRQSLTDFGRTFYERARIILAEVDAAENLAAETRALPIGKLRINAPVSFGMRTLATRLPDYMKMHPQVEVDLTLSNRAVDLIDEGYDAVFRVGTLSDSGLIARQLAPYRLVLCASPGYLASHAPLVTPWDLQQHDCLGFSHTELRTHWAFDGPDGHVSIPIASRLMVDHGEPLLCAALAELGVLLQPLELVREALADGRLIELLPDYRVPTRPLHVLYAPDRRITPKLRSFLDFAVEAFG